VRVIESNDASTATPPALTAAPVSVMMRGGSAEAPAGWAYVNGGHGIAIAVSGDYGVVSGSYTVRAAPAGGVAASLGTMRVDAGRGSWTGRSDARLTAGSRIALVDASGAEVCHGTVPTAE
jgi:hypothetical protein